MAEETFQQIPWVPSQPQLRQASNISLAPPSVSVLENRTTASKPSLQRRSSHQVKASATPSERSKVSSKRSSTSKSMSFGPRDRSSRGSLGTMNDSAGEITYTPTTHRISKAKKGKKVHACEFPGCPKIFTRAEHRKRHEANHNSEPLYQCCIEDCRKPFQRVDLLTRHMERQHNMPAEASLARSSRSQRSTSEPSVAGSTPPRTSMVSANMGQQQPIRGQTMPQVTPPMSIGAIIEPSMQADYTRMPNDISQLAVGIGPRSLPTDLLYGVNATAESPLYSSDSCYSPMSDYLQSQANTQRYLVSDSVSRPQSSPLEACYQPQFMASPMSAASAFPVWDQFDSPVLGGQLEGSYLPTVAESAVPIPLPYMGGYEWRSLRNEFTSSASVALGQGDVLDADSKFKHYLDCYWLHFHPLVPIVHYSTMISAAPPPLLALLMVSIGAQFSSFSDSKTHSAFWFDYCVKFLSTSPVTTYSIMSDMQTLLLFEAFTKYRGRGAKCENIAISSRFRALLSSLLADEELLRLDPFPILTSLPPNAAPDALDQAKRTWTLHETKRRILLAAFVLDIQHGVLFGQQSCCTLDLDNVNLPYPCSSEIWNCNDLQVWRNLVGYHQQFNMRFLNVNFNPPAPVDAFQSCVLSCYQIYCGFASPSSNLAQNNITVFYSPETHYAQSYLTHHALQLASLAPIDPLLIVSSGSWLFGSKITDHSVWTSAKLALRVWVSTENAAKSVWHAIQVLRLALGGESLHMLHEQWCINLAALACWAYGFLPRHPSRPAPDPIPPEVAETQSWEYLAAMNVSTWEDIPRVSLRWHTRGVIECVRLRVGGHMGGLLNQVGDVLARLVEGRNRLIDF